MTHPLVSICIPTYNRAHSLGRAIESAIRQDYKNLEIMISDNASTDETERLAHEYLQSDSRVHYIRQNYNVGLVSNLHDCIRRATGTYRMWLADDDWLDRNLVSESVSRLASDPALVMVAGRCKIYDQGVAIGITRAINVRNASPLYRVLNYYATVADNSVFYGLYRAEVVTAVEMSDRQISADWQFLATIAYRGKIATLNETYIHREAKGESSELRDYARKFKLRKIFLYLPYLAAAAEAFSDIARENNTYSQCSSIRRKSLAVTVYLVIVFRKVVMLQTYRALKKLFSVIIVRPTTIH